MCKVLNKKIKVQIVYAEQTQPLPKALQGSLQTQAEILLSTLEPTGAELVLFLCDETVMQNLNQQFRGKNAPTDVLSFESQLEDFEQPWQKHLPFGEIALCLTICEAQATEYGWSFEQELFRLLIHGMAHLAGYTHENELQKKIMQEKELELWKSLHLPNPLIL